MGACRFDAHAFNEYGFTGFHLDDPMKPMPRQERGRAVRRDGEVILAQPTQRRQVKMIGVQMGEKDRVEMQEIEVG
jgi:hypothetical protein